MLDITSRQATRHIKTELNKFKEIEKDSVFDNIFNHEDTITLASRHRIVQLHIESELDELEVDELIQEKINQLKTIRLEHKIQLPTNVILDEIKEFSKSYESIELNSTTNSLELRGVARKDGKDKVDNFILEGEFPEWRSVLKAKYLEDAFMLAKKCKLETVDLLFTNVVNRPIILKAEGFYYLIAPQKLG